jgi:methylenetetrahydrofolate dehydrogenase (NADP+)/methenyltetrahydrofolate cyclohydrolase
MAEILKGKPVADAIKAELTDKIAKLKKRGTTPKLGIIRVGARPDDLYYEGGAKKTCDTTGMNYEVFEYPEDVVQNDFEQQVISIGNKKDINGILMFAPLPKSLDEKKIRSLIPVQKDVDCMNIASAGLVYADEPTAFPPCTPAACMEMLHFYNVPIKGKRCVVLGRSLVVGKPTAMLLLREHGTVTICHSRTVDLPKVCKEADILIAAIGRAKMVNADYVKKGQIVIDVGINTDPDNPGKYCGDVDFDAVEPIVDKISSVPGGVGSITTAMLCKHTVIASGVLY